MRIQRAAVLVLFVAGCTQDVSGMTRPMPAQKPGAPKPAEEIVMPPEEVAEEWTEHGAVATSPPAVPAPAALGGEPAPSAAGTGAPSAPPAASASAEPANPDDERLELTGRAIQGGLVVVTVHGKARRAALRGRRLVIGDDGQFLVGFARDASPIEKLEVTLMDGTVIARDLQVEQRSYDTDRVNGLPDETVRLDPRTRAALHRADAEIDAVRRKYSPLTCYGERFVWPAHGRVTSRYGQPRVLNGVDGGVHWGVDIAASVGSPVRAPACGTVVYAKEDVPLAGNMVVLDHGHGLTSTFLHLARISVKPGDELKQGAVLGAVGATGRVTGAHLDWRMNLGDTRLDPELLPSHGP